MPAFEWVHVQLHQQKGMISLSPPTICNSARCCHLMLGNCLTHNHCHPELLINVEPLDFNDSGSDG
nr:hypothetical protein [Escherichia coli]